MKLICTQENFKKAIHNCERVVAKRNTLPILNNILLETEKGGLKFSATNLEIGVTTKIGAKIEKEGKITIPAKLIGSFSANLSGGENITIEVNDDNLKIKNQGSLAVIKGMPANDFPLIPSKKTAYLLEISSSLIKDMLSKVLPAAAVNEARQELTGINLIFSEKELFFAATDSFRLSEYVLKLDMVDVNKENYSLFIEKINSIIIPALTLAELNRIIPVDGESKVKIAIEDGQIFFEIEGVRVVSRLINGKYPEYKHIIPQNFKTRIVGPKNLIQNAVKIASLFSSGGINEITLKINSSEKKVFVKSSGSETGENSTELKFDITGPDQEVVFNPKYLLDGINVSSGEQLALLFNSESTPAAIKEINEKTGEVLEGFTYIVMPIKN